MFSTPTGLLHGYWGRNMTVQCSAVLFSGGMDSTLCLLRALQTSEEVVAVSFDYGQRHAQELDRAEKIIARLACPRITHRVLRLPGVGWADSPLLAQSSRSVQEQDPVGEVAPVVVPGRNLLLVAAAVASVWSKNVEALYIGCCASDLAGFPDCRPEFIFALRVALQAMEGPQLLAPCLYLTKKEIAAAIRAATYAELGEAEALLELTWSCYAGGMEPCGTCAACVARAGV